MVFDNLRHFAGVRARRRNPACPGQRWERQSKGSCCPHTCISRSQIRIASPAEKCAPVVDSIAGTGGRSGGIKSFVHPFVHHLSPLFRRGFGRTGRIRPCFSSSGLGSEAESKTVPLPVPLQLLALIDLANHVRSKEKSGLNFRPLATLSTLPKPNARTVLLEDWFFP